MKKKEENICFCGGEKNEDGKGGKYLEKENIFLWRRRKKENLPEADKQKWEIGLEFFTQICNIWIPGCDIALFDFGGSCLKPGHSNYKYKDEYQLVTLLNDPRIHSAQTVAHGACLEKICLFFGHIVHLGFVNQDLIGLAAVKFNVDSRLNKDVCEILKVYCYLMRF